MALHHLLDTFQLLSLQWCVETFTLRKSGLYLEDSELRKSTYLEFVELHGVQQTVLVLVA